LASVNGPLPDCWAMTQMRRKRPLAEWTLSLAPERLPLGTFCDTPRQGGGHAHFTSSIASRPDTKGRSPLACATILPLFGENITSQQRLVDTAVYTVACGTRAPVALRTAGRAVTKV